jgi:hypothetical protein
MSTTFLIPDVQHSTRLVLSDLETLRDEYNLLLSSTVDEDKYQHLQQSIESIDLGIDEAFVMLQLDNHFENLDNETHKLMLQVQRLTQENNWLRDELSLTEKHLQTSTHLRQDYERDIHLLNESLASSQSIPDDLNSIEMNPQQNEYKSIQILIPKQKIIQKSLHVFAPYIISSFNMPKQVVTKLLSHYVDKRSKIWKKLMDIHIQMSLQC